MNYQCMFCQRQRSIEHKQKLFGLLGPFRVCYTWERVHLGPTLLAGLLLSQACWGPPMQLLLEAIEEKRVEDEEFKRKYPGKPYLDTENTQFADLLKRGCLAVIRSSYFEKQAADNLPFQERQSIPDKFFIRDDELLKKWDEYGARFLAIVSSE